MYTVEKSHDVHFTHYHSLQSDLEKNRDTLKTPYVSFALAFFSGLAGISEIWVFICRMCNVRVDKPKTGIQYPDFMWKDTQQQGLDIGPLLNEPSKTQ